MRRIQGWIHGLEEGKGARYLKVVAFGIFILFLGLVYNIRAYHNFGTQEAMDSAQLARNIAEGKGYTTLFIRPLSLYLVIRQAHKAADISTNLVTDVAKIKTAHPDIANPPVYPLVLAGLMKALPFRYPLDRKSAFWSNNGVFWRYEPDFLIALFNEMLLLVVVAGTFFLARKLFDARVAWLSAILLSCCELLWRFSVSGLSTMLLMVIFVALIWCVQLIEEAARDPKPQFDRLLGLAIAAGVLTGIGALTRYAFGWVIIPLIVFLVLFGGTKRMACALAAMSIFLLVLIPWIIRNFYASGMPFGTASFSAVEGTAAFPGFQLERSIYPDLAPVFNVSLYISKLFVNTRSILQDALPKLAGSWVSMLFITGLLLNFRSIAVRRMRYFSLMCLLVFVVVQALNQTQLSEESPEVNSENLLVLLSPVVFVYGASLFLVLLDQMVLPLRRLYHAVRVAFIGLCCLPLIFALLPLQSPVVFPPYYPPDFQAIAGWMNPDELTMSDVPWAMAWYGQRQCVWLTLNTQNDFFAINDYLKPVQGLYLTPKTLSSRLVPDCLKKDSWSNLALQTVSQNKVPTGFPLNQAPQDFLPDCLFLSDWSRWESAK